MKNQLDAQLLRALRDAGPQTKNQLAERVGAPRTTLAGAFRSLVSAGHVEDGPLAASSGGRRSVSVRIAPTRLFVAVLVGEHKARVAVLDGHLSIVTGVSIDLRGRDSDDAWISGIVLRATRQVLGEHGVPAAIGVADVDTESVVHQAVLARLGEGYPGTPISTLSAVRAMALGEQRSGLARDKDDFVAIRLGASVSMATVAGGRLSTGAAGRSGEISHLKVEEFGPACTCGLTGCLDSFAGSAALVAEATELVRRGRSPVLASVLERAGALDLDDLLAQGRAGDPVVAQLGRDLGQRVGKVIAGLVAHANPRSVVLGGPVAVLGTQILGDLRATVYRLAPPQLTEDLEITVSSMGEQGVLAGAATTAIDAWIESENA